MGIIRFIEIHYFLIEKLQAMQPGMIDMVTQEKIVQILVGFWGFIDLFKSIVTIHIDKHGRYGEKVEDAIKYEEW